MGLAGNAQAVTQEEVQQQWKDYYALSKKLNRADYKEINKELEFMGKKKPTEPKKAKNFGFKKLQFTPEFFNSEQGKHVMEVILSFQTPSGGWSKDIEMTKKKRGRGESYGRRMKSYVPTFDNEGTSWQMRILAKAVTATGNQSYQEAFLKGLDLILAGQYPNGGWPQNYPLDGGYHDLITYNDRSMINLMNILKAVVNGEADYTFVPKEYRARASESFMKGINYILMSQINVNGKYSIWAAQYDQFNLTPAQARAFEPPGLATAESVDILKLLMSIDNPPPVVVQAVDDAVAWFESSKIMGKRWKTGVLSDDPEAKPLWGRFYDINTNQVIFGDRDGKVYDDVTQISKERREGYGWYKTDPNSMLKMYKKWRATVK